MTDGQQEIEPAAGPAAAIANQQPLLPLEVESATLDHNGRFKSKILLFFFFLFSSLTLFPSIHSIPGYAFSGST